jgi:hypothetical protein
MSEVYKHIVDLYHAGNKVRAITKVIVQIWQPALLGQLQKVQEDTGTRQQYLTPNSAESLQLHVQDGQGHEHE